MRRGLSAAGVLVFLLAFLPLVGGRADATFPGGVGRIAFASDREGAVLNIFTMNPDGSNPARVTEPPNRNQQPAFHPRGRDIVFVSNRGSASDIFEIGHDGGIVKQRTNDGFRNLNPSYDASGRVVVFQTNRGPVHAQTGQPVEEIFSMDHNGKNQKNLTLHQPGTGPDPTQPDPGPANDVDPQVGSNGRIVFASDRDGRPARGTRAYQNRLYPNRSFEIYSMRLDGSDVQRLRPTVPAVSNDPNDQTNFEPAWSPDGQRIAFVSDVFHRIADRTSPPGNRNTTEILVMNADGTGLQRLTTNSSNGTTDRNPAWSPDGTQIVWDSDRHGVGTNREIYMMNADGSGQTRITNNGINDREPAWQSVRESRSFDEDDPPRARDDGRELGRHSPGHPAEGLEVPSAQQAAAGPAQQEAAQQQQAEPEPTVEQAEPDARLLQVQATQARTDKPDNTLLKGGAVLTTLVAFALGLLVTRRRATS